MSQPDGDVSYDSISRPLRLGVRVGHPLGTAGSLGAFVHRKSDPSWSGFLSTRTALAPPGAKGGDFIHQPPPAQDRIITGFTRVGHLEVPPISPGQADNTDGAIARLLPSVEIAGNLVPNHRGGAPKALSPMADLHEFSLGDVVAKVGSATGLTLGVITAIVDTLAVDRQ